MYYQYDALGNVTDLTDRLGENVVKYRWDAFGGMFAGVLAPYSRMGITGKEYDPKTGQVFFGSRWYNPMVGQFIMPDTFMGQLNRPQSLNAYAYAWNNPVNRIDPTGHWVDNSDGTYTAESGDTLWGLAEQTTGDGSNWTNLGYDGTPKNLQIGETIGTSSGGSSSGGTSSGDTSSGDTSYGDTSSGDTTSGGTSSNGGGSAGSGYSGGDDYTPPPPPPPEGGSISLPAIVNDTYQGTGKADSTGGTDKANIEPGRVKMHVQGIFSDYVKPGLIGAGYGAVDVLSIILLGPVGADLVLERWSARLVAAGATKGISKNTLKWLSQGNANISVYFGIKNGEAVYTGITKQELVKRLYQHNYNGKGFEELSKQVGGLAKNQARAVEQYFIENGPANALNNANSISPNSKYYNEALKWAKDFVNNLK